MWKEVLLARKKKSCPVTLQSRHVRHSRQAVSKSGHLVSLDSQNQRGFQIYDRAHRHNLCYPVVCRSILLCANGIIIIIKNRQPNQGWLRFCKFNKKQLKYYCFLWLYTRNLPHYAIWFQRALRCFISNRFVYI